MILVGLKIILFAILIIAPIIIGRQLYHAARGATPPAPPEAPVTEEPA